MASPTPPPGAVVFGGPLWPLGSCAGFLQAPFDAVRDATLAWKARLHGTGPDAPRVEHLEGLGILDQLGRLAPLTTPVSRELVVELPGWTAHFSNPHSGGDSTSWVGHLSSVLDCVGVEASHTPQSQYPLPATQLSLVGPTGEPPLRGVRSIACGKFDSGRWSFETRGAPQPFEEPERYAARLVRDRFGRAELLRYLARLGLEPDRPEAYGRGLLFEKVWGTPRVTTLEAYRAEVARPR